MNKTNWNFLLVMVVLLALGLPCGSFAVSPGEVVEIGGTGGALGGLQAAARAFNKKHPDITFRFAPSLGSSGGISALLAGALGLAVSSRPLKNSEKERGASAVEYARTPFIFVTFHKGRLWDLTMEKLVMIYAGQLKTWPDGTPLRLIRRPKGDIDTTILKSISPAMDKAIQSAVKREGMVTAVTDQDTADFVERIRGSFAALTLGQLLAEQRPLRTLRINGTAPTLAALANGSYRYFKTFYIVTGPQVSRGARMFIDYLRSPEGGAVLRKFGHLPAGK